MRDVIIDRVMTTDPLTIAPSLAVVEARLILQSNDLHHLPVIDDGKLVGILSASDMLKFAMLDENSKVLGSLKVQQVMRADPHVLTIGSSLRDAAATLSRGGFHALPVVEADRTLVGIVTSSDLIHHLLRQLPVGDGSIRELRQAVDSVDEPGSPEKTVATLTARNRQLNAVYQAAERYVRSGHADHEHSVLVKCLSDIREVQADLGL
jgi:CBS domain-containing protein